MRINVLPAEAQWILRFWIIAALLLPSFCPAVQAQAQQMAEKLPLGDRSLPEIRTRTALATGLDWIKIQRGIASQDEHWTIQVSAPDKAGAASLFRSLAQAQQTAVALDKAGFKAGIREEKNPSFADLPAGTLGYSVRVGQYAVRDDAKPDMEKLSSLGYRGMPIHTGEDGDATSGPWNINVLIIDPAKFQGEIRAEHGSSIGNRVTAVSLARQAGALAAVNGGFFVMIPSDGIPGDPAGLYVSRGKVLSEATNGRIAMNVFNRNSRKDELNIKFQPLTTVMTLLWGNNQSHAIHGINRKPGVIRNCGGISDTPSNLPRHDFTCTDPDELAVITPEFGAAAPAGEGLEAVVDSAGKVIELRNRNGGAVPEGGFLVQAIGREVNWLKSNIHAGDTVHFKIENFRGTKKPVRFDANDEAINGGPGLVVNRRAEIRPVADGLLHPDDASFFLRWGVRRNPRTMAGVDSQKRILLVTADGHQPGQSLGLTLVEGAQLMLGLGAVSAMNLDGGGSTTMVIKDELVNVPSDPAGARPVGDILAIIEDGPRQNISQ